MKILMAVLLGFCLALPTRAAPEEARTAPGFGVKCDARFVDGHWSGTDDTAAIIAFLKARVPLHLRGFCALSAPVKLLVTIQGADAATSGLVALPTFQGSMLVDCNDSGYDATINHATLDVRGAPERAAAIASSSAGGAGGCALGRWDHLLVVGASRTTAAINAPNSRVPEVGMFTGAVFDNLKISAPLALALGSNHDDITFNSPRFDNGDGGADCPVTLGGSDLIVNALYFGLTGALPPGQAAFICLGPHGTTINGAFLESTRALPGGYGFKAVSGGAQCGFQFKTVLRQVQLNVVYAGREPDAALIHANLPPSACHGNWLEIDGVDPGFGGNRAWPNLLSLFLPHEPSGPTQITLNNVDAYEPAALMHASGGTAASASPVVYLRGWYRGTTLAQGCRAPRALRSYAESCAMGAP